MGLRILLNLMIVSCLSLRGEDQVTVLSAAPEENVLLEVSCDGPRRLEMSADLEEWKPVVSFLPELDRFHLEAPQFTRKVTYFRLVNISSDPNLFETSDLLPEIADTSFMSWNLSMSFSEDGTGALREGLSAEVPLKICTWEIIDRQPGVISVGLNIPDGSRTALTLVFAKQPFDYVAWDLEVTYSLVQRFGDFYSYAESPFGEGLGRYGREDYMLSADPLSEYLPEIEPLELTGGTLWLNREREHEVRIEIVSPTQGQWVDASGTEIVSLEFHRTGPAAHTCIITRKDGSKTLAQTNLYDFQEGGIGEAWELPHGATDYPCPGESFFGTDCGTYWISDLTLPTKN